MQAVGGHIAKRRMHRSGMTLVEILVVLAIVGVMAGVVTLGVGAADRGMGVETEANRLADRRCRWLSTAKAMCSCAAMRRRRAWSMRSQGGMPCRTASGWSGWA